MIVSAVNVVPPRTVLTTDVMRTSEDEPPALEPVTGPTSTPEVCVGDRVMVAKEVTTEGVVMTIEDTTVLPPLMIVVGTVDKAIVVVSKATVRVEPWKMVVGSSDVSTTDDVKVLPPEIMVVGTVRVKPWETVVGSKEVITTDVVKVLPPETMVVGTVRIETWETVVGSNEVTTDVETTTTDVVIVLPPVTMVVGTVCEVIKVVDVIGMVKNAVEVVSRELRTSETEVVSNVDVERSTL
jgi:hypothetical protein